MRTLILVLAVVVCACGTLHPTGATQPSPSGTPLPASDLQYRLIDRLGPPVFCDPSQGPIVREDPVVVARQVADLRSQHPDEFDAIVRHEHLDANSLSDADNQRILSQSHELAPVPLTADGAGFRFRYQVIGPPSDMVTGTIDAAGTIAVQSRSPGPRRMCPLAA